MTDVTSEQASDHMLFAHYNVPGFTDVTQWSADGQPLEIIVTEVTNPQPGTDDQGNDIEGPAYWADGDPSHKPDFTNYWWDTPIRRLMPGRFVSGRKYRITGSDELPVGYKYKIWYGGAGSDRPTEATQYTTNGETFERGTSVEITATEENVYLAAYNTDRNNLEDWGYKGEPCPVTVEDLEGTTNIQGPGYFGGLNEDWSLTDFTNPHWERIFHWNNAPQHEGDDDVTFIERGENYRFSVAKMSGGNILTKHDYDIWGAKDEASLIPGPNNPGNFQYLGTLRKTDDYLDIREIPYDKIIFTAINLPNGSQLTNWSPEGEPVLLNVKKVPIGRDPNNNNRFKKGPAYFADKTTKKPDFSNIRWMSPLNYYPGISAGVTYKITGDEGYTGALRVFFAKTPEALRPQSNNPNDFIDTGISIVSGESEEVTAETPYMIFGHWGKLNVNLEDWSRDGEPALIQVEVAEDEQIFGPCILG